MTERTTHHATFVIDRTFAAPPALVFAAFATAEGKQRWFVGPAGKWTELRREFDFRVGGREIVSGAFAGGPVSTFECRYLDIVPEQRIVHAFNMTLDDRLISISLATVEFEPAPTGTRLIFTEQLVYLNGYSDPDGVERRRGTNWGFDNLEAALRQPS